MRAQIHPKWYPKAVVTCACGNTFTMGSTLPEIHLDVCSACHPYFTGQMKYVDTAGRVDSFRARQAGAAKKVLSKTERREIKRQQKVERELNRPETLSELRTSLKKKN